MSLRGGVIARRTPELLEDGNDDFILHVHESGRRIVSQCGREAAIEAGGGLLTSNADPSAIILPDRTRFASIGLPRSLTKTLAPGIEDALVRPLPAEAGILRLLMRYLDLLDDPDAVATPDLRRAAAAHIHDLCALAIGASREVKELAAGRGLRTARLLAIKEDIARNLNGDDLSAEFLARRQRVTPRYIHKLFESEGLTLSQFVLSQRLVKVHRALMDPRHAGETIGAIAFGAGFGDLSTFNRAFRRRFGATPSDVRAAARS
ncbi:MAG TPA: helix-turn-helix domain-containing protein [Dongiaceae bacterium]|nr:helix-turn-helix domain-containing protein [Dongiaceae bacterium]